MNVRKKKKKLGKRKYKERKLGWRKYNVKGSMLSGECVCGMGGSICVKVEVEVAGAK